MLKHGQMLLLVQYPFSWQQMADFSPSMKNYPPQFTFYTENTYLDNIYRINKITETPPPNTLPKPCESQRRPARESEEPHPTPGREGASQPPATPTRLSPAHGWPHEGRGEHPSLSGSPLTPSPAAYSPASPCDTLKWRERRIPHVIFSGCPLTELLRAYPASIWYIADSFIFAGEHCWFQGHALTPWQLLFVHSL